MDNPLYNSEGLAISQPKPDGSLTIEQRLGDVVVKIELDSVLMAMIVMAYNGRNL
jgi:hypothetical protein